MAVRPVFRTGLLCVLSFAGACGDRSGSAAAGEAPFRVVRVTPSSRAGDPLPAVWLNQEIQLDFSEPIDPLTVHVDTVHVLDAQGRQVPGRVARTGRRTVTFFPVPPLQPDYRDGSFRPGARYRLVVVGFPRTNGVCSESGALLAESSVFEFRAVDNPPGIGGLPTPFLPVDDGEPFAMRTDLPVRMPAGNGVLRVSFNLPVLPESLSPGAIQVLRVSDGVVEQLDPEAVWLEGAADYRSPHFGSTVGLRLGPRPEREILFVAVDPSGGLRDYRGRTVAHGAAAPVLVDPGDEERVFDVHFGPATRIEPADPLLPSFAVDDRRRAVPNYWAQAGEGTLGHFRPARDVVLEPGHAFDLGGGRIVTAPVSGDLHFASVEIPAGVEVVVRARRPVLVRTIGDVTVEGTLVLETPGGDITGWGEGQVVDDPLRGAGFGVFAGRDLQVAPGGTIRHTQDDLGTGQSPATMLCGGELRLLGTVPVGVVLDAEQARGASIVATAPFLIRSGLLRGAAPGTVGVAQGVTEWFALPPAFHGAVDVQALEVDGALTVSAEFAESDSLVADLPRRGPGQRLVPMTRLVTVPGGRARLGFERAVTVPPQSLVRLHLRAAFEGRSLPSTTGFVVLRQ